MSLTTSTSQSCTTNSHMQKSLLDNERIERDSIFISECDAFEDLLISMAEGLETPCKKRPLDVPLSSSSSDGGQSPIQQFDPLGSYRQACEEIETELAALRPDPLRSYNGERAHRLRVILQKVSQRNEGSVERDRVAKAASAAAAEASIARNRIEGGVGLAGMGCGESNIFGKKNGFSEGENEDFHAAALEKLAAKEDSEWRALQQMCDETYGPLALPMEEANEMMLRIVKERRMYL